jgi:small multidrug resistance pump
VVFLFAAIAAEVLGTSLIRSTAGFSRVGPTIAVLAAYGLSFLFLSRAVDSVPVGVAYAIWSGLGTVAIVAIAAAFLHEPLTPVKVAGVALIIAGTLLLNLTGTAR